MIAATNKRSIVYSILTAACLLATACGGGPKTKVIEGAVSVAGQKADGGEVRFVPIEGTPGSTNAANITDGQYRITARGGVPMGKYRVEVVATKKTGRQVMEDNGFEKVMGDEYVKISPPQYAGIQSTIVAEITADSDGKFDINITQ